MLVEQSLDRINTLERKIHAQQKHVDQINRTEQEGKQLILENLEVGVENRVLFSVKNLSFDMGKVYAITGESGCGKTSLLSKIKNIKENGVTGKGNIFYPVINDISPKIVMISQQEYFPMHSSLLEIMLYPNHIPKDSKELEEKRQKILFILEEIGFEICDKTDSINNKKLDLNDIKDWYTELSGGEKKKLFIASAIMQKPDILLLDEVFTNLDSESIILIQQMLKKYLPNTLMLIVDHHACANNHDLFYDKVLVFSNGTLMIYNMQ